MRIVLFCHSLVSDWNHGNAHFLRGVASELIGRGHQVRVFEPVDAWSVRNLVAEYGHGPLEEFRRAYPCLAPVRYNPATLDLDAALAGADLVLVHEWNEPELVGRIGRHRREHGGYRLLFHDTHHRSVTAPESMAAYDLSEYDGVLAFGESVRRRYLERGWTSRAWTWHEAADVRVFYPRREERAGDLVWIGNWGDDERSAELREFLLAPAAGLKLRARVYGVRYPEGARAALAGAGIEFAGWVANYRAPEVFSRYAFTIHVPRRPYAAALPGVPTIRMFEALACGIPLICAPWEDSERLFTPGRDFLVARSGAEMREHMRALAGDATLRDELAAHGLRTIHQRHTCAHRADELLAVWRELEPKAGRLAGPLPHEGDPMETAQL